MYPFRAEPFSPLFTGIPTMSRKLSLVLVFSVALLVTFRPASGGWWHHHHHQQGIPVYYSAPQAAPMVLVQEAPTGRLAEALIPVIVELIRGKGQQPTTDTTPNPSTTPGLAEDIAAIKKELGTLSGAVENANSTLRRHGEEITNLRLDLAEVKASVDAMKGDVATIKLDVSTAGDIQTKLQNFVNRLPLKSKQELLTALQDDATVFKAINNTNAAETFSDAVKTNLKTAIKKEISDVIDKSFPKEPVPTP